MGGLSPENTSTTYMNLQGCNLLQLAREQKDASFGGGGGGSGGRNVVVEGVQWEMEGREGVRFMLIYQREHLSS